MLTGCSYSYPCSPKDFMDTTHDNFIARYAGEFVDAARNRHAEIERGRVREAIERENKFEEIVRQLRERLRLK